MHRNARRAAGVRIFACLALLLGIPSTAVALPLISEVFYDAVGSDDGQVFVELSGTPGTDLTGFTIEGINGSGGSVTVSIALSGVIAGDGLFVLADTFSGGGTAVPDADALAAFDFQNGPDSVVLRDAGGEVVDAIGYGSFGGGDVFAGEGSPAPDPPAGSSLARLFANVDSDDNAIDFEVLEAPTPGVADFAVVPEPSTAVMMGMGLLSLAVLGRRRHAVEPSLR